MPSVSGEFVARMEDVLDVYAEPEDPKRPKVRLDECPHQVVEEVRRPLPAKPEQPRRVDYEYRRNGTRNLPMMLEPDGGCRHVEVTDRRTMVDFAQQMKALVGVHFPDAELIRVIIDNLNTHDPGSLYEAFAPAEARRIAKKLEFHFTSKHGSWLNAAEVELAALCKQCLGRRIPDVGSVRREIGAWERQRNEQGTKVHWRFSSTDARTKLARLYPARTA